MSEYRTIKDIMKEIAKAYTELGKLLGEIDNMVRKEWSGLTDKQKEKAKDYGKYYDKKTR